MGSGVEMQTQAGGGGVAAGGRGRCSRPAAGREAPVGESGVGASGVGASDGLEAERAARAALMADFVDPRSRTVAESAECGHLGSVGSTASVGDSGYVGSGDCGCGRPVCVGSLDIGSVRVGELLDLMVDLGEARARLEGMLMAVAGEVARRNGWESVAWLMREYNRVPAIQARAEAGLAHTLAAENLTETVDALSEGEITLSHARVVARAAPKPHTKPEAELLELSRVYPADVVGRHTLAYESAETDAAKAAERKAAEDARYGAGPAADELRDQRAARRAKMHLGEDGMWHLSASLDFITGRRVHQIFQAAMRSMRNRAGSADHSHAQRAADVVAELLGAHSDCTRQQTTLLVLADYDHVRGHLTNPRLDDGTPIPVEVAAELATRGRVMPVLFDANWQNIAIGTSRNPNEAQRMLLAARDGGCIGCRATVEESEAHHNKFWRDGGPTLVPNLALLCHSCHDLVHEHDYEVHTPPDGHPKLRPPEHLRLANPPPATNPVLRT